jgi:hypothetical protein
MALFNYLFKSFSIKMFSYEECVNILSRYCKKSEITNIKQDIINSIFEGSVYDEIDLSTLYFFLTTTKDKNGNKLTQIFLKNNFNIIAYDMNIILNLAYEYCAQSCYVNDMRKLRKKFPITRFLTDTYCVDYAILNNNEKMLEYFGIKLGSKKYKIKTLIEKSRITEGTKCFIDRYCEGKNFYF